MDRANTKFYITSKRFDVSWKVVGMVWGAVMLYQLDYIVYFINEVL